MEAVMEALAVWNAFQNYKDDRKKIQQEQVAIPEFCFPTCGKHPNPKAKKALEGSGFVHREGAYGIGYYADNVR